MSTEHTPDTRPNITIYYYGEKDPEPTGQIYGGVRKENGVKTPITKEEALFYWLEQHEKNTILARLAAGGVLNIDDRGAVAATWEIKNDKLNIKVRPQDKARVQSLLAGFSTVSING